MIKKPRFKIYRREKINIFLKNFYISNKSKFLKKLRKNKNINKKNSFSIPSHYSNQIKEKRKLKIIYGISDKTYNIYYSKSKDMGGDISYNILKILECRLDNIIYRSFFSYTRPQARQMISHKFFLFNNKYLNFSSRILKVGDYIKLNLNKNLNFFDFNYFYYCINKNLTPEWIFINKNNFSFYLKRYPTKNDLNNYLNINNSFIFGNCNNE
ncbi:SSU ribosomal protein S4p (S9e) [Candidatus Nasuia deltocephalinicola]|uniref:Small ribosomal subunit protein uS4 n=1 Tax=Candidatus Nasuia deltocephalincola TaxID=1160784 RepID=A0A7G6UHL4_9PROT|nr:SSU ribosomal protein S4p (S9e) [Candidatus Nasuia deltocephalinicola]